MRERLHHANPPGGYDPSVEEPLGDRYDDGVECRFCNGEGTGLDGDTCVECGGYGWFEK